jgi:hypothetical protein
MSILIQDPWMAAIVACGFWLLWRLRGHRPIAISALMWAAYLVYEYLMRWRILCSGECNIRVDLLLIYPVLGIMSLVAVVYGLKGRSEPG